MAAPVFTTHKWLNIPNDKVAIYNAHDTYSTAAIVGPIIQELRDTGNYDYFKQWFSTFGPVVQSIQRRGFGQINQKAKREAVAQYKEQLQLVERGVRSRMGDPSQYTSKFFGSVAPNGGQRARLLFDELNLKPAPIAKGRVARSTSQSALGYVLRHLRKRDEPHKGVLHDLFHRSRLQTIQSRYLKVEETNGRVRPTIKLGGAESFRLAYANPALQQWPPEIRHIIQAAPGHVFISADSKQLEGRISAVLSNDAVDLAVFAAGEDIHTQNARDLFGYSQAQWDALSDGVRSQSRQWAKTWRYAIGYGADPNSPGGKLFCPCDRCRDAVPATLELGRTEVGAAASRWGRRHQATTRWRDSLVQQVLAAGRKYTSPWGHTRTFFTPMPAVRNEIYNYPCQHGAACYINSCMVRLSRVSAPIVLQMHDEIVLEVPIQTEEMWARVLKEVMEEPVEELGGVVLPCSVGVSDNWGGLK